MSRIENSFYQAKLLILLFFLDCGPGLFLRINLNAWIKSFIFLTIFVGTFDDILTMFCGLQSKNVKYLRSHNVIDKT